MKKSNSLTIKLFLAFLLALSGVLWIVSATTETFAFNAGSFWSLIAIGLGVVFALGALFEKSAGYGFLFALFFVNGIVFMFASYTDLYEGFSLSYNWAFNISSIAFGELILAMDNKTNVKFHLKNAIIIAVLTTLLYIANIGVVEWVIILPILAILVAGNIVVGMIAGKNENENTESETYEEFDKSEEN